MTQQGDAGVPVRRMARPSQAFWAIILALLIAPCLCMFLPPRLRNREPARQTMCKTNLKQIGLAVLLYQDSFGDYPPDLEILITTGFAGDSQVFRCPSQEGKDIRIGDNIDAEGSYYYARIAPGGNPPDEIPVPIAWDKKCVHRVSLGANTSASLPGVNVLHSDGSATTLTCDALKAAVAKYAEYYAKPPELPAER